MFKLVLYGVAIILITVIFLSTVLTIGYLNNKREKLKSDTEQYLKAIAYSISPALDFDDIDTINEVFALLEYEETFVSVKVKSDKGIIYIYEISEHPLITANDKDFLFFNIPILNKQGASLGTIEASVTTQFLIEDAKKDVIKIAYITIIILIITSLFIVMLAQKFVDPIIKLKSSTEAIARDDFSQTIKVISDDEIGDLSQAFNLMTKDLKKFRDELLEAKLYTESIILNMADMLVVFDKQGMIKTVNKAILGLLGYSEKELVGKLVSSFLGGGKDYFDKNIIVPLSNRKVIRNIDLIYIAKDGRRIPVNFSANIFIEKEVDSAGDKEFINIVGIAQDMCQIKELISGLEFTKKELEALSRNLENKVKERTMDLIQSQEAMTNIMEDLDESKSYIEKIIVNLLDMLIVITVDGKIQTINPIVKNTLGYSEEELIDQDFPLFLRIAPEQNCCLKYLIQVKQGKAF